MTATATPSLERALPLVAIAGNPNTGKTTLFNRLTGSHQKVGNYPGITVEQHKGKLVLGGGRAVELVDVPGAYSLSARSREEEIAIQAVAGIPPHPKPELVVIVVDATQLARNLYLVLQVIELGLPVVVALNMSDLLEKRGLTLDLDALRAELGVPVVRVSALRDTDFAPLLATIEDVLARPEIGAPGARWTPSSKELREHVRAVEPSVPAEWIGSNGDAKPNRAAQRRHALALWALLSIDEQDELADVPAELRRAVLERRSAAARSGMQIDAEVISGRYGWIDLRIGRIVRERSARTSLSERIDGVLLNPWAGFPIFLLLMGIVFQSLFSWADPLIQFIEARFADLGTLSAHVLPPGLVQDFVENALIAGVGSVIVFLPQILLLFLFIGVMEDSGYMARLACLMDRLMRALGLHGRAFVPMLSGYACAVPAILATRTMERQRDRVLTMMVIPLMSCSARLPVYGLVIAALFPAATVWGFLPAQGLLMVAMYLFSTLTALAAAAVLSRTLFKAPSVPLIQELPPYRMPHWPSVLRMMWQRSRAFLVGAGTVILACTVVLWVLLAFPKHPEITERYAAQRADAERTVRDPAMLQERLATLDAARSSEQLRASFGGALGHAIEPTIAPLGFDWKIGVGLIGAFAAREVFVSTLGVVYGAGKDADEKSQTLRALIREETRADGKPVYTPLMGLSLMVFFALACQCMSTLAAVYRETRSWRWPVFLFVYMTALAWVASFVVYQGGRALGFG
ncbi:MAG: ferrous iron transport protein B [Planctomycetes bacterium]|nr:ferrous iron transport protein B [Planctomycetota bacterium]